MSPYIRKSVDNLKSADYLIGSDWYEASAHSAYYSVFLLSKELLKIQFGVGDEEQRILVQGPRSHQMFFRKFVECLSKVQNFEPNNFLQWFSQTNMLRNKADYKPEKLSKDVYESNVNVAHSFINGIKDKFELY